MSNGSCNCGPDAVPCFGQVVSELSAAIRMGFIPEAVGRNPDEEWKIYCGVRSLLPKEPRCTATAFVGRFMKNAGMVQVGEHVIYRTRAAAVIGILARLDSTLFTPEGVNPWTVTRPWRALRRTGPFPWRSEDDAELPFPELKEVYSLMGVPTEGERKNLRGTVIVEGVYRMMRRHYLECGDLPAFGDVANAFGITAAMPLFPMCFLTWVQVKALQARIAGEMDAVYRGDAGDPPAEPRKVD
ncbi:MAG: hypothetical protein PHP59_10830 [Methanofollis sp.]|uniref:hypothetical protein n=1 Tax=Methanofollis sp. TaxID=2052835 RepID=UPI002637CA2C|nr:hypothetical protein [Methanofollis sp.]MDD4255853.1 hypothetical protein [Methanofollis sp.]